MVTSSHVLCYPCLCSISIWIRRMCCDVSAFLDSGSWAGYFFYAIIMYRGYAIQPRTSRNIYNCNIIFELETKITKWEILFLSAHFHFSFYWPSKHTINPFSHSPFSFYCSSKHLISHTRLQWWLKRVSFKAFSL